MMFAPTGHKPFFITALPRSGTTFLSAFLTYDDLFCVHEATCGCETMPEFVERMRSLTWRMGTADSALPAYHRAIKRAIPDALWIGVERDPDDVMTSLCDLDQWPGSDAFAEMVESHQEALLGCEIRLKFKDLFLTETLRYLWQNISSRPFNERRAAMMAQMRIQPDMARYLPRYHAALPRQMAVEQH